MAKAKGLLRWGANFTVLSVGLHILGLGLSGFGAQAVPLAIIGLIFAALAYGLMQGLRWLGYVTFIALLIGTIAAVSNIWSVGAVPGWVYISIAAANLAGVCALFLALWKPSPTPA